MVGLAVTLSFATQLIVENTTPDYIKEHPQLGKLYGVSLDVEYEVTAALKSAISICEQEQDYDTREMLEKLLDDTEMDHAYWLEKQLGLIDKIGLKNYQQSQM